MQSAPTVQERPDQRTQLVELDHRVRQAVDERGATALDPAVDRRRRGGHEGPVDLLRLQLRRQVESRVEQALHAAQAQRRGAHDAPLGVDEHGTRTAGHAEPVADAQVVVEQDGQARRPGEQGARPLRRPAHDRRDAEAVAVDERPAGHARDHPHAGAAAGRQEHEQHGSAVEQVRHGDALAGQGGPDEVGDGGDVAQGVLQRREVAGHPLPCTRGLEGEQPGTEDGAGEGGHHAEVCRTPQERGGCSGEQHGVAQDRAPGDVAAAQPAEALARRVLPAGQQPQDGGRERREQEQPRPQPGPRGEQQRADGQDLGHRQPAGDERDQRRRHPERGDRLARAHRVEGLGDPADGEHEGEQHHRCPRPLHGPNLGGGGSLRRGTADPATTVAP
ncbi:MAG: hypothetical protein JWO60_2203 [Frankiales bacterium]|nr:hypothetical protein [Frankiales bacterium]